MILRVPRVASRRAARPQADGVPQRGLLFVLAALAMW
jgi:hypothetical protein